MGAIHAPSGTNPNDQSELNEISRDDLLSQDLTEDDERKDERVEENENTMPQINSQTP